MLDKPARIQLARSLYALDKCAKGRARFFLFNPNTGQIKQIIDTQNLVLYSGADILAKCLSGDTTYAVASMYLEFKNLADPGDPITPPAFDREGGIGYYNDLASSPDTDYLRVPLMTAPDFSSSDADLYTGNQALFFAMSEGTTGIHAKAFGPATNSAVYGAALVATPDPLVPANDVVFSRTYTGIGKILKEAGFEIGVSWTMRFN